ncbi:MAG: hypothetical protein HY812_10780 [Planctomycetes bacterium]|nr:hypothetical protein [Planctomycetota bacterium]
MLRARCLLLLAALLPLCGCQLARLFRPFAGEPLPAPAAFRDGSIDDGLVRRVLALPLADESGQGAGTLVVSEALRDEILKLGRFTVVQPTASDAMLRPAEGPQRTGRIPVRSIIELGRRYGVEAVLFGSVTHYRPYAPQALAISAQLIDVQTGKIVWSVSDFVDGSDAQAVRSMEWYFADEAATGETVFGPEIMNTSPRWFARFAASRIAATLAPPAARS